MLKILFVNGNLHGHINPTLPVVKELVHRGNEVYYYSTAEFKTKLEAAGAVFMDYGREFDQFVQSFRPHGNHPFYTLMEYMLALDRTVVSIVLRDTGELHFDCIIHDVMFGGGNILAKKLNLPSIGSCSSFVIENPPLPARMLEPGFHPQLDDLYGELRAAKDEWQLEQLDLSDIFFKRADRTLVYTSRLFQPSGDSYAPSFRFVGPSIMDRGEVIDFPVATDGSKQLIYIALGTINNRCMDFYQACLTAFQDEKYQVILSVGSKVDVTTFQEIPDNFVIRNYIPQLEVLKRSDVFISHGGLNSVSEALYYGVPVIAVPMANDQPAVAKRLTELGAGLTLKPEDITPALLLSSVQTILADQGYRDNCATIGTSFQQAGGYKAAADEITDYIK